MGGLEVVNSYWIGRYGFNIATGELIWEKWDVENRYSISTPVRKDGKVYYTAYRTLIEMGPRTGEETKRVKQGHIFNTRSKMLIKDGCVLYYHRKGGLCVAVLDGYAGEYCIYFSPDSSHKHNFFKDTYLLQCKVLSM